MVGKDKIIYTDFHKGAYGLERRENLSLEEMYKGNPFPKTVSYKDIDNAFKLWVRNSDDLKMIVNGEELPTFMLVSNQRFSEYSQTWSFDDDNGNIILDFKTVTRDPNPKAGSGQSKFFNIPGEPTWAMFYDKIKEDNSDEGYNRYSIKQPVSVDLSYTINIVATHFETINEMNTKILNTFKSLQHYIRVNGHFMPLILDDIGDKSEYNLENRKFFHQQYNINCLGYIIQEEDFKVERLPHKMRVRFDENERNLPLVTVRNPNDNDTEAIDINIKFKEYVKDKVSIRVDEDVLIYGCKTHNVDNFTITRFKHDTRLIPKDGFTLRKHDKITIKIDRLHQGDKAIIKLIGKSIKN